MGIIADSLFMGNAVFISSTVRSQYLPAVVVYLEGALNP